jgi:Helix-turn-helix domain
MTDTFTRDKFAWLDQVLADENLPATAFRLAYVIGQHLNRQSGKAWPSQKRLGEATGLTARTVRSLTEQLQKAGHLEVELHRGRNHTNVYRLPKNRKPASGSHDDDGAGDAADSSNTDDDKEEGNFRNPDEEKRKPASGAWDEKGEDQRGKRGNSAHEKGKPASDKPSENQAAASAAAGGREEQASARAPGARALEKGLEEFWLLWQRPYYDDRQKVYAAFTVAVSKHDMADILASARRWAAAREPKYLPEPVKWLEGGWQSEPPPKRSPGAGSGHRSRGRPDPVTEALRAGGFDVGERDE